jgi:hypothetical protein
VKAHITTDFVHYALTEISAPSPSGEGKVAIYPSPGGLLSNLRDWLRDDIEIGDAELDPAFLITGTPPSAAKALLASEAVRQRLCTIPIEKLGAFTRKRISVHASRGRPAVPRPAAVQQAPGVHFERGILEAA